MGDLIWVRFFSKPLVIEFFFLTYNGVRFFSSILLHERYCFQSRNFFWPGTSLQEFFPLEISLQDIFSEITHTPLKSQMFGPFACMFCFSSVLKVM